MKELADLEKIIANRLNATSAQSYTKSLLEKGARHTAKKFGEEAVEFVIATSAQDTQDVINEAGDVLYHLLVALRARNISLAQIYEELTRRTAQSGLEEKAARAQ